jgi:hypothetical protein
MSNYRYFRLGLILAVVVGGLLLHHHGDAYVAMRIVYAVVVVGLLGWRLMLRRGRATRAREVQQPPQRGRAT